MSTLVLVRHAQASFFEEDYDKLSELGERQARRLGEYFSRKGIVFDEVYTGPARRHRRTAELVGEELQRSGLSWPEPIVLDDLNEHAADRLLKKPDVADSDTHPHVRALAAEFRSAAGPDEIQKGFQRLFEAVVTLWTQGEFRFSDMESWEEFGARVRRGIHRITADNGRRGRRVLSFSSVGPITVALHQALETPLPTALTLGWRLRNCSVTSFLFDKERITLDAFNSVAHLENPHEVTYR